MSTDSGQCFVVEGGGCHGEGPALLCDSADSADSGTELVEDPARLEGGSGCTCHSGQAAGGLWLTVAALTFLRRFLAALLLMVPGIAQAIDSQHLQTADGGTFLSLMEVTRSAPWSVRAALATSYTRQLVVLRSESREDILLDKLTTAEIAASLAAGEWLRLGIGTPVHTRYTLNDEAGMPIRGDMALWAMLHMSEPDDDVQRGWTVALDLPASASSALFLGDPGSIRGRLTSTRDLGTLTLGLDAGVRLQQPTELPELTWANRLEGGIGLDWALGARSHLTAELLASAPLDLQGPRGAWPAELLISGRHRVHQSTWLRVGAGAGLTAGIGSPTWRLVAMVESDNLNAADRDGDGLPNVRDLCASRPEDFDGFRDSDGCPDPDNDSDGLLDLVDACPNEPEVRNEYQDADGCPDAVASLLVTVRSSAPELLEKASLTVNDNQRQVLPGEPNPFRIVPGGRVVLEVSAPGHELLLEEMPLLHGGEWTLNLTIHPIRYGEVDVRVTDEAGMPLDARTEDGTPITDGRARLTLPTGQADITVSAEGYLPASDTVFISASTPAAVTFALQSAGVWVDGSQLKVGQEIRFALDSAALTSTSDVSLQRLADWLAAHPEVLLLRVEGLADALGSPAYNHRLSIARAQAVRQWLIDAGIDPDRLEAIGSGEAMASGADEIDRSVRFSVIVWTEEGVSDAKPAAP